ncbi:oxidoreductase FAD-binding domain protein [Shewanella sediminis HAW-EB3]|uniref:Oxidoreductase FAD-binding domain protein n=1 Tax=Shewanella sediminis (strain HAW-EB3) TaxID=425104 RepID=A8FUC0_SHESH|nr:2Fe-2S iron-sulfur cluster-binding protein [Shewanella sediminis]ABV36443.1 oxidoreductase FAD-binding domain protein [Shewanella sediminis HAW-EB3]
MTKFYFDGQGVDARPDETVLDALLREGHPVNYSCKKGRCKTCLVQHLEGELMAGAQRGLTSRLKENHYLCSCQCRPTQGLKLKSVLAQDLFIPAKLYSKEYLSDSVVKLKIEAAEKIEHKAGQHINLRRFDGLTRSYSITNGAYSEFIELHVRRKYNGQFSDWLFNHASIGENILIQGPWGDCCYSTDFVDDTLILIGSGTGLGSVYGIARDALVSGHRGEIYLYHGARNFEELYQHSTLLKMMMEYRNFTYQACIESDNEGEEHLSGRVLQGDPFDVAMSRHPFDRSIPCDSQNRFYLCGEPSFVSKGQETIFLNGTPLDRVHVLSFDYKDLRSRARD